MVLGLLNELLLLSGAAVAAQTNTSSTALLFFDDHHLASSAGLSTRVGTAHLLAIYRDPTAFVGWGYPSVWSTPSGYRCIYQGWHLRSGKEDTKLALVADSADGVHWQPAQLKDPKVVDGAPVPNAANVDGGGEFSVVYDDEKHAKTPAERLKMLWGNATISSSADGEQWHAFGRWTSTAIDPGISLYRNPLDEEELVVTSRPQALRHSDGTYGPVQKLLIP